MRDLIEIEQSNQSFLGNQSIRKLWGFFFPCKCGSVGHCTVRYHVISECVSPAEPMEKELLFQHHGQLSNALRGCSTYSVSSPACWIASAPGSPGGADLTL